MFPTNFLPAFRADDHWDVVLRDLYAGNGRQLGDTGFFKMAQGQFPHEVAGWAAIGEVDIDLLRHEFRSLLVGELALSRFAPRFLGIRFALLTAVRSNVLALLTLQFADTLLETHVFFTECFVLSFQSRDALIQLTDNVQ